MIEAFQKKDVSAIDEFVKVDDPALKVKSEDIQGIHTLFKRQSFIQ